MSEVMEELRKLSDKMELTRSSLEKTFKDNLEQRRSSLEQQLDGKIDNLCESMGKLIKQGQDELRAELQSKHNKTLAKVDMEVGHVTARIDQVEAKFNKKVKNAEFDPEVSLTISGMLFEEGEDLMLKLNRLFAEGLKCDPVPGIATFGKVYIRSAKSHAERLIDLNFRMLLDELPSGNGRVVRRDNDRKRETGGGARAGSRANVAEGRGEK